MNLTNQIVLGKDELREAIKEFVLQRVSDEALITGILDGEVIIDVRSGGVVMRDAKVEGAIITLGKGQAL